MDKLRRLGKKFHLDRYTMPGENDVRRIVANSKFDLVLIALSERSFDRFFFITIDISSSFWVSRVRFTVKLILSFYRYNTSILKSNLLNDYCKIYIFYKNVLLNISNDNKVRWISKMVHAFWSSIFLLSLRYRKVELTGLSLNKP